MGQILHGSARTTAVVRRAIQHSQESLKTLSERHGINPKTVAKWCKRTNTADAAMEPKEACSTVLTSEQEAMIVAFRKLTLLALDDYLYVLQPSIPCLPRCSCIAACSAMASLGWPTPQEKGQRKSASSAIRLATSTSTR
jgi:hypothetical protein